MYLTLFLLNWSLAHLSKHPSSLSINHEFFLIPVKLIHYNFYMDESVELSFVHKKILLYHLGFKACWCQAIALTPSGKFWELHLAPCV
jgi:hypothetical protein